MLTLQEIENIIFREARFGNRGYMCDDVDNFVDGVVQKVRELELRNRELESRIEFLNSQLRSHEDKADSVQDAIITAEITSKTLIKDATVKAEKIMSDATVKAEKTIQQAEEESDRMLFEAESKAQVIVDNTLRYSAEAVDENNRIIETQKRQITQIQDEVSRLKEALIESYRQHLQIINELPKAEDFRAYEERIEETYVTQEPVRAEEVSNQVYQETEKTTVGARPAPEIKVEINREKLQNTARRETEEITYKPVTAEVFESPDSNADEIQAIVKEERNDAEVAEPKPLSIDEIDDGMIFNSAEFNSTEFQENFRIAKSKREPIKVSSEEETSQDKEPDDLKSDDEE